MAWVLWDNGVKTVEITRELKDFVLDANGTN